MNNYQIPHATIRSLVTAKFVAYILICAIVLSFGVVPISTRASFTDRCSAAGVVLCTGFDSASDVDSFVYGDDRGRFFGTYNEHQKSSGTGSLRFEIPTLSPTNSSGGYERILDETSDGFLPGETVYLQYRQYFDSNMLNNIMGGSGWKQIELTTTYGAYNDPVGIGLFNQDLAGAVKLYIASTVHTPTQNINYVSDQWMTFYYKVVVGEWGTPTSQVSVWVGINDQPMQQIYNVADVTLNSNPADVGAGYNKVIISPTNSGKLNTVEHPSAFTWFDELIVSSQPIADPAADTQSPTIPLDLSATAISSSQINLSWSASTDNIGVSGYKIFRDNVEITSTSLTQYSDINLNPNTEYSYSVLAMDAAGNFSDQSPAQSATTLPIAEPVEPEEPAPDITNPTQPTSLTAEGVSTSTIKLSWSLSSDDVGVVLYKIYRDNQLVASVATNNYDDTQLSASNEYSYTVRAADAAGNLSEPSTAVVGKTQANPSSGGGSGSISLPSINNFSVSSATLKPNQNAVLQWNVYYSYDVSIDQGIGSVLQSGVTTIAPTITTTYTLTAKNSAGQVTKSVTVVIDQEQKLHNYSDGTLLIDNGTIYVIEYGVKRAFVSMPVFLSYGYKLQNVIAADTKVIREGGPIVHQSLKHVRGSVVVDSAGAVWFIGTDYKYAFPSESIFLSWGNKFSDIVPATTMDLLVPTGPIVAKK